MRQKKPITIKIDADLLDRLDKFQSKLTFPATRTGLIETALAQMLEREEKKAERKSS